MRIYVRVLLEFSSYGSLVQWGIADFSVMLQNILLSALNSGSCLFSRLFKFIYRASRRLYVVDSEIKWSLLNCKSCTCYIQYGCPFPAEIRVCHRCKKCIGMPSECIMEREETVSAFGCLFAFSVLLCFSTFSLVCSIKSEKNWNKKLKISA